MRESEDRARIFAKRMRRSLTDAETILWSYLRRGRAMGLRFRRQHPIGPFVADFACVAARLVIEVDGATHGSDAEVAYDARRTAYLTRLGWHVMRVSNGEIYEGLDFVLDRIVAEAKRKR